MNQAMNEAMNEAMNAAMNQAMKEVVMNHRHSTSPGPGVLTILVTTLVTALVTGLLAAPAAAQPAPPAPAAPGPEPDPAQPSTEPTVQPPPATPPGTGQPSPPPAPPESAKPGPAPSPGQVTAKWTMTIYGFAEFDLMHDSTQSFSDSPGNGLIVRPDGSTRLTYNNGRTQTTGRNSRLGVRLSAPESHGLRASGNVEMDFMGNQPAVSEASFVNNGTFRLRAAYAKLESDRVDVLAGQYYFLFGEGPFFFPMSIWFFGLPNQAFGRTQQLRLSHTFKSDAVNLDLAVSLQRPPQRDAEVPDFQGGLKLGVNAWKGPHTIGSGYAAVDPLTVAVSGSARRFRVNEFAAAPATTRTASGWGVSLDGMIPIVPAASAKAKGNAVTATGSFVTGHGIGDLIGGLTGGATFPALPPAMPGGTPPAFAANIDNGIVQYDASGNLHTINWQTFMAGAQYYLPPNGEITIGANYTQGESDNITDGLTGAALGRVMKKSQFFEAVVLGDITPAVRAGVAWQRLWQTLGDGVQTRNNRLELSVYFFF
jgi:outer membrane biosynthesis protein TonB